MQNNSNKKLLISQLKKQADKAFKSGNLNLALHYFTKIDRINGIDHHNENFCTTGTLPPVMYLPDAIIKENSVKPRTAVIFDRRHQLEIKQSKVTHSYCNQFFNTPKVAPDSSINQNRDINPDHKSKVALGQ